MNERTATAAAGGLLAAFLLATAFLGLAKASAVLAAAGIAAVLLFAWRRFR